MNQLLFIGIDDYTLQPKLNCCVKDCKDILNILVEKYSFNSENTDEIYNENASNLKIQEKLKEYHSILSENDNLIIYYSGHGGYDKTLKKGYWIPYDSDPKNFTTWIGNETILSFIKQISAKHIFLISDSCFSRSILVTEPTKSIFSNAKDYDHDPSRWALTSGAEECMDGSPDENSFFGETILQILKDNNEDLRVSKLIELVKQKFHSNIFQKPQGYPLNDPKHRTGEFIFKVVNEGYEQKEQIKGYKDFLTLLQLYKRNADFKELSKYENKSLRIGYQIYQEHDKVLKKVTYFLHLYEGINQQKTYEYIREKHSEIFREKCLIILLPKEKKQTNPEKRKQNINDKFQPLNIFYIDEFIREQCTPKNLVNRPDGNYLDITNFISPSLDFNKKIIDNTTFFVEWLQHENEPIMILKGEGGIGKTTFAQYIADKFLKNNQDASVLFINSSEIRAKLEKNYDSIGVYNFYEALHSSTTSDHEMLNEDLFRLNLDAGNFLLIIDGLDEVISKVAKFNVDDFLNSIIEYTSDIGNGKIIITCRSYFWELSKFSVDIIKTIEILPFNTIQTLKFFEKSFANNQRKIEKSLKIAEEYKFIDDNGNNYFHPYVLAVVCSIVESDQQVIQSESSFTSKILEKTVKNDYIIYRICYRERLRVEQISVDEQVEFFSYWSIKRRGLISIANFSKEMAEALGKHIDKTTIEAFKSHPFILVNKKTVQFKYDFFADYFKSSKHTGHPIRVLN